MGDREMKKIDQTEVVTQDASTPGMRPLNNSALVYDVHTALATQLNMAHSPAALSLMDRADGGSWIHVDVSYHLRTGFSIKARTFHPHNGMSQVVQQFVSHVIETERMQPQLCQWLNGLSLVYHRNTDESAGLEFMPKKPLFALQWPDIPAGPANDWVHQSIREWSDRFVLLLSIGSKPLSPSQLN